MVRGFVLVCGVLAAGCGGGPAAQTAAKAQTSGAVQGPRIRVVGTMQDGGLPHASCSCERCDAARVDPAKARAVASLAILDPANGTAVLVDATPDLPEQLDAIEDVHPREPGRVDRAPLDGILLTHAHIGHYLGLAHLGFEVAHTKAIPVWASASMQGFLRDNGPWDQLVKLGNIELRLAQPGQGIAVSDGIEARPIVVPHRAEYTDTLGFVIAGPRQVVLYVPDTSPWDAWDRAVTEVIDRDEVDVALVDGSFYSMDELPGRDVGETAHPLMVQTMDLLQSRVDAGTLEVRFVHLNHSNPALTQGSTQRREIERRGFAVAMDGDEIGL